MKRIPRQSSSSGEDLVSLCGILKPSVRGVTLSDMEEAIRAGAAGAAADSDPALDDDALTLAADQVFLELDRREDSD
jgi:hypothetical protein